MSWVAVEPKHKRGEVDRAGEKIINPITPLFEYHEALQVVNNWRSAHSWPLNIFQTTLRARVKGIDTSALVAQRLKRMASIETKLRRFPKMKLSQVQDLGGCRAVVSNLNRVDALLAVYEEAESKNKRRHEFVRKFDYIAMPKSDGYRGIHLVYKYRTPNKKYEVFNGLRIEVQMRSQLQHAWATAVETVDTFTGQALKSSAGNPRWARFFLLMASVIAMREKTPLAQGTPTTKGELRKELRELSEELQVRTTFMGWQSALGHLQGTSVDADLWLLVFDIARWHVSVMGFKHNEIEFATEKYLQEETEIAAGAAKQAVLVGIDSLEALRKAYPSYHADTTAFLEALAIAVAK